MDLLLGYARTAQTTGRHLERALRARCRILTCGPSATEPHDVPCAPGADLVTEVLPRIPPGFAPDAFLWIDSAMPFLPRGIANLPFLTAGYGTAFLFHHLWQIDWLSSFDVAFVNSRHPELMGDHPQVRVLRNGAPAVVPPNPLAERPIDVAFVGTLNEDLYPERNGMLFRAAALALERGWRWEFCAGLSPDEMMAVYARAKVVINRGFLDEGLNLRAFEAMIGGAALLTDDGYRMDLETGRQIEVWKERDLESKLDGLLQDPDKRLALALAGQAEAAGAHSYDRRADELIAALEGARHARRVRRPEGLVRLRAAFSLGAVDLAADLARELDAGAYRADTGAALLSSDPARGAELLKRAVEDGSSSAALSLGSYLLSEEGDRDAGRDLLSRCILADSADQDAIVWPPTWERFRLERCRQAASGADVRILATAAVWKLGSFEIAEGNFKAAVEPLERVVADWPTFAEAHGLLGYVRYQIGRHESAQEALARSLELDPLRVPSYCVLARMALDRGDPPRHVAEILATAEFAEDIRESMHAQSHGARELFDDLRAALAPRLT